MSDQDEKELAWWRVEFSARFAKGGLPRVGQSLLSPRFTLLVHYFEELVEWSEYERRRQPA